MNEKIEIKVDLLADDELEHLTAKQLAAFLAGISRRVRHEFFSRDKAKGANLDAVIDLLDRSALGQTLDAAEVGRAAKSLDGLAFDPEVSGTHVNAIKLSAWALFQEVQGDHKAAVERAREAMIDAEGVFAKTIRRSFGVAFDVARQSDELPPVETLLDS